MRSRSGVQLEAELSIKGSEKGWWSAPEVALIRWRVAAGEICHAASCLSRYSSASLCAFNGLLTTSPHGISQPLPMKGRHSVPTLMSS